VEVRCASRVVATLALLAAACGGTQQSDDRSRSGTTTSTEAPTTTTTTTTTTIPADLGRVRVTLTKVADVTGATALAVRHDDPALYVAQQNGRLVALHDGQPTTVLDLSGRISSGKERGLLGIAFSPDGSLLYVHFTDPNGDTAVEEYAVGSGGVDVASRRVVFSTAQPQANHNGGQLTIGPDGMLYLALGDGGGANDSGAGHTSGGNGQSLATVLGKILRIDPHASATAAYGIPADNPYAAGGGRPEIWAYGLRNPWRFSFDRATDDLWIGDVGQNAWEEIDMVPFARAAGANFGWNLLEGSHDLRGGAIPGATVLPVFETSHADGDCAIVGGYVYRGSRVPDLVGSYLFSDNCNTAIRAIRVEGGRVVAARDLGIPAPRISSFGEGADGELYALSQSDGIFRIDPA
jgi:glucose/arabinose dehydrogenase